MPGNDAVTSPLQQDVRDRLQISNISCVFQASSHALQGSIMGILQLRARNGCVDSILPLFG